MPAVKTEVIVKLAIVKANAPLRALADVTLRGSDLEVTIADARFFKRRGSLRGLLCHVSRTVSTGRSATFPSSSYLVSFTSPYWPQFLRATEAFRDEGLSACLVSACRANEKNERRAKDKSWFENRWALVREGWKQTGEMLCLAEECFSPLEIWTRKRKGKRLEIRYL
jgi:hypothetical protein